MSELMLVTAETTTTSSAEPNTNVGGATMGGTMDTAVVTNQGATTDSKSVDVQIQPESDVVIDNPAPVEGEGLDSSAGEVPVDGEIVDTPVDGEVVDTPVDGETVDAPVEGEVAIMPAEGDMGIMPVEGDMGMMPVDGNIGIGDGGMYEEVLAGGAEVKDPIMSSWFFVIGVSAGVLAISVFVGVLLARRKIKKGIELYED